MSESIPKQTHGFDNPSEEELATLRENSEKIFEYQALVRNKNHTVEEKILEENQVSSKDIAHEQAHLINNRVDQLITEGKYDEAIRFGEHTKKELTKSMIDQFEEMISLDPNLKRAIETGNFIPQFKSEIAKNISNPIYLRLFAGRMCKSGITKIPIDDFFIQKELWEYVQERIIRRLALFSTNSDIDYALDEYIENNIFPLSEKDILFQNILARKDSQPDKTSKNTQMNDVVNIHNHELLKDAISFHGNLRTTSIEQLPMAEFISVSPNEIPREKMEQLVGMYNQNYSEEKGYTKEFRESLIESMKNTFSSNEGRYYLLDYKGDTLGFIYLKDLEDLGDIKHKYFGMFNIDPQINGSKIGSLLFREVLKKESSKSILEGLADPDTTIFKHYIEKDGFIGVGVETKAGKLLVRISKIEDISNQFVSKRVKDPSNSVEVMEKIIAGDIIEKIFTTGENIDFSHSKMDYFLTRVIENDDDTFSCYFEKLPNTVQSRLIPSQENLRKAA